MQITINSIRNVSNAALTKVGFDSESIKIIVDSIIFANQRGVPTHGVGRLPLYIKKVQTGHISIKNEIETVNSFVATAVLDAHNSMGQVAAYRATELAIEKAREYGVSVIGVRNSNNFGTAGFFGDIIARNGMIAIICANAAPAIAPTGGSKTIFGTNPICFAFPREEKEDPILLDMATTVVARGKIRLAARNGEKIPLDWALGPDGNPTDDPNEALKGSLLPIGGYKGYGLSLFVDLFAGLLTGSAFGGEVKNLGNFEENSRNGHLFVCIDVNRFEDKTTFEMKIKDFCRNVRLCGKEGSVFLPGEIEYQKMRINQISVEISENQIRDINQMAESIGIKERLEGNG